MHTRRKTRKKGRHGYVPTQYRQEAQDRLVSNRYFNINQDFAVIKGGGFFCQACIIGKEKTEISPDPRYCQDCYDFLREAKEVFREGGKWQRELK